MQNNVKPRDYLIDNAKVILILLIILGHLAVLFTSRSTFYKGLFISLYSFHFPMLVFLSGVVSSRIITMGYIEKSVRRLIIPLVAFQLIYESMGILLLGSISGYTLNLVPFQQLDFLLCLFIWRMLVPVLNTLRFPITISIFISVVVGYGYGNEQTILRTFTFLPFFIVGNSLGKDFIHKLKFRGSTWIYLGVLSAVALGSFYFAPMLEERWLTGYYDYRTMGMPGLSAGLIKLAIYPLCLITGISFLGLVPATRNRLTHFGANTMVIYLWHELYKKSLVMLGVTEKIYSLPLPISFLGFVALAGLIFYFTSADQVSEWTEKRIFTPFERLLMIQKRNEAALPVTSGKDVG